MLLSSIIWGLSTVFCFTIFIVMFYDWLYLEQAKLNIKAKLITGFIGFAMLLVMSISQYYMTHPNINRKDEVISITKISEVYKSNIDAEGNEDDSCYYVIKENDTALEEIVIEKTIKGDDNYIITKKYSNGDIIHELVLKSKDDIKPLPSFNK